MRNRILILFLLLNLTAVFFAQAVEWKRYENKGGNFSVLFPGEPKDTASDESEGMESHTLAAWRSQPAIWWSIPGTLVSKTSMTRAFRSSGTGSSRSCPTV